MNQALQIWQNNDHTWNVRLGLDEKHDISGLVSSAIIQIEGAGKPAKVTLELIDLTAFAGMADVVIDPVLHSVLLKLGWRAPDDHCPSCHDAMDWPTECTHEVCPRCSVEEQ